MFKTLLYVDRLSTRCLVYSRLGGHMEVSLRRAMVLSDGDWAYLLSSSIIVVFWVFAMAIFVAPFF